MSAPTYGGQAVIEGVMIRGPRSMAVAVRAPDGEILTRAERLGGLYTGPLRRVPLVRGVVVLWETMALGFRALMWSSAVAAEDLDEHGEPKPLGALTWAGTLLTLAIALAFFFAGPTAATAWLDRFVGATWITTLIEGALRLALLLGYIWLIGRSSEIARVFQYHGAEHMTIRAFEDERELRVPVIRRYRKEHPRCGTSFLLTVAVIAVVVFVFVGGSPLWWRFASRIVLIPFVAGVAYEVIRFGGSHTEVPLVRLLFAGNLALQRLTTRVPDDEQIQVAIASLERVRAEEESIIAGT
ncbi:MAG: DUF1385 domain-containing protein [Chloroflexi bacterium]|nr:DUF1385 domain-containing protein [Chloroflexota bacterium]MDA1003655.1 DUF1385 domain-containing protein [Chloroflexota bacterium]